MKNKQLRRFVVFLSCLSLILSFALPVSAEKTTDTGTFLATALPSDIVVSSIMNGIGVLPGQNTSEYKSVVDRCVDYLIEQGRVVDGKIEVWQREQVGDYSLWKYGVDVSMVDVVRSWLFDNGVARNHDYSWSRTIQFDGRTFSADYPFEIYTFYYYKSSATYHYFTVAVMNRQQDVYVTEANGSSYGIYCKQPGLLSGVYYGIVYRGTVQPTYNYLGDLTSEYLSDGVAAQAIADKYAAGTLVVPGLTSGYLPVPSLALTSAYPEWAKNSIAIPLPGTDEDVEIIPFAPGQTLDDTLSIPQTDVWNGAGTYTDTPSVPGTATLSDILAAVLSIPKAIVSSITEALSKFFGISGSADSFGISLTEFFPFCIPFDIYDFLSVLSADPVAPVFHWELPVPQLGRTFEIDVDLSAWDPVAAVFRTFELLAFVVGLGMVTREKFLRS